MMESRNRIGFIGLGKMGGGIARNLVRKGFTVTVVGHRNRVPVDGIVALGAREARTAAEATEISEVVIICVSDTPAVESIVYGSDGILSAARPGLIVLDCTTSEPSSTARIAADFLARGAALVDTPVARSPTDAEAGRLNAMVGADIDVFRKVEPILRAFCANIFHAGGSGSGHMAKLIYNFLTMGQVALISEALVSAKRAGLDLQTFCNVVSAGGANSGIFQMIAPSALTGNHDRFDFGINLARKDMRYYTHLTEQLCLPGFLGEAVHQSFVLASSLGFGDLPVGALINAQEQFAGVAVNAVPDCR